MSFHCLGEYANLVSTAFSLHVSSLITLCSSLFLPHIPNSVHCQKGIALHPRCSLILVPQPLLQTVTTCYVQEKICVIYYDKLSSNLKPIYIKGGTMLKKISIFSVVGILFISLVGFFGCRQSSPLVRVAFMMDYLTEMLDLTTDQQAQLKQSVTEVFEKSKEMRPYRVEVRKAVIEQLKKDTMDQEALVTLILQNQARTEEMVKLIVQKVAEFHKTLSPEQRAKLIKKIEDSQAGRKEFFEKRFKNRGINPADH
jgi:periplasmic protein CpxP/Spy